MVALSLVIAGQPELRPVDAGTEDVSVNSTSRLLPRVDQRKPVGFDQVYEMTKPDGRRVFIRMSGDIYAEFDRSVYTADGETAVPPGTVFKFGSPTDPDPEITPPATNRVDYSAPTRVSTSVAGAGSDAVTRSSAAAIAVGEASIVENELYRRVRISQLLFGLLKPGASEP
jgi:hypothetical protein